MQIEVDIQQYGAVVASLRFCQYRKFFYARRDAFRNDEIVDAPSYVSFARAGAVRPPCI